MREVPTSTPEAIIAAYDADAASLFEPYEEIDSIRLHAPVQELFPPSPARVADIGAGTGRDAAWLARLGYDVVAVEPAAGLREAGEARHATAGIHWLDDRLPLLPRLSRRAERFDLILSMGVWHHLDALDRARAMPVLAGLLTAGGSLLLSIRHGPTPASRPGFDVSVSDTVKSAREAGLEPIAQREAPSLLPGNRAAGVVWTWLVLRRPVR